MSDADERPVGCENCGAREELFTRVAVEQNEYVGSETNHTVQLCADCRDALDRGLPLPNLFEETAIDGPNDSRWPDIPANPLSKTISITLTAKEKTGRYYEESTIRHLVATCGGTLFWDAQQDILILRTRRENGPNDFICLLLAVEESGVTVINQTTDHYDWDVMDEVTPPVGPVGATN